MPNFTNEKYNFYMVYYNFGNLFAFEGSAKEYLEKEIFPVLLPALDKMLRAAVENDVLKVKSYLL